MRDAAPGLRNGENYATTVNGVDWFPVWPTDDENRSCNCDSTSTTVTPLANHAQTVVLSTIAGRGTLAIASQPTAANGYTLTVNFDDPAAKADWYEATIMYATK